MQALINGWADIPLIIAYIIPFKDSIKYNPHLEIIKKSIFEEFITEKVYTVIYRKSFIDPQEFPAYMNCFEEVFETSVDQNSNLNMRIKEDKIISDLFSEIKTSVDSCIKEVDKFIKELLPVIVNYNEFDNIDFKILTVEAKPDQLKDLLEKFIKEQQIISKLKSRVNMGLFELNMSDVISLVHNAPDNWINKMKELVPKVLIMNLKDMTMTLNKHLKHLSIQINSVENFISLKLSVEEIQSSKNEIEQKNSEIVDILAIMKEYKDIKLPEYDMKLISEKETLYVEFEKKLDSMVYFIETNLAKYKQELKDNIKKFDKEVFKLHDKLNDDILNVYNEDSYSAIFYIEDLSVEKKKAIDKKVYFKQQELQIEIEDVNSFESLETLIYEYDLKSKLWYSVREFQDQTRLWKKMQVLNIDLAELEESINNWIEIGKTSINDLESIAVPKELLNNLSNYEKIIPILKCFKNENVNQPKFIDLLKQIINIDFDLNSEEFTMKKLMELDNIYDKSDEIFEISHRADEEKRLNDIYKQIYEASKVHKIPLSRQTNKKVGDKVSNDRLVIVEQSFVLEYEFVEEKLMLLKKILLNVYSSEIEEPVQALKQSLDKYLIFLNEFSQYQKFVFICEAIIFFNVEFQKEMPNEYKKFNNENTMKNLQKILKENSFILNYAEVAHEKVIYDLRKANKFFEDLFKAIEEFLEKKRKENLKFYLLSNEELLEIYSNTESLDIKKKFLPKMLNNIKNVELDESDETIKILTIDDELIQFKSNKNRGSIKEILDLIELEISKKLKLQFKIFKKDYQASLKNNKLEAKNPKEVLLNLILNRDNLGQSIFNFIYSIYCEIIEKTLISNEDIFDKLIDIKIDAKERKKQYISLVKAANTSIIDKRILLTLISLDNYFNEIIKNLIREDVSSVNDFNWMKLINLKVDSENCLIKIFNLTFDYGYEYVGLYNNFMITSNSEKVFLTIANCFYVKKPFFMYGFSDSGKKETLKLLSKFFGKAMNIFKCTQDFDIKGFNKLLYGTQKSGNWLCLDNMDLVPNEALSVIAHEIMLVYKYFADPKAEFISIVDKIPINRGAQIFCLTNVERKGESISNNVKNYFRLIGLTLPNLDQIITCSLKNLTIKNVKFIANKIKFVVDYLNVRISALKYQPLGLRLFNHLIKNIAKEIDIESIRKYNEIEVENKQSEGAENNKESIVNIIRNSFSKTFVPFLNLEEKDDLNVNNIFYFKY